MKLDGTLSICSLRREINFYLIQVVLFWETKIFLLCVAKLNLIDVKWKFLVKRKATLTLKIVQVTKLRCYRPESNFLGLFLVLLKIIHNLIPCVA